MGMAATVLEHENMDDNTTPEDLPEDAAEDMAAETGEHMPDDMDITEPNPDPDSEDLGSDGGEADDAPMDAMQDAFADDENDASPADAAPEADADTDAIAAVEAEVRSAESVWKQDKILGGAAADEPAATIPPPQPAPPYAGEVDRLVRDPHATLGGVGSGIAHRYGFDVALTRLALLIVILFSGGTAFLAYLLAWLIILRATYWPPTPSQRSGRFSSRELGIGLTGLGALLALAIGGGTAGSVLIPLALVGGGVWMLVQEPKPMAAVAGGGFASPPQPPGPAAAAPMQPMPAPAPAPVQPRSKRRRFGLFALIAGAFVALLAVIAIPIGLIIAFSSGNIDIDTDRNVISMPLSVGAIPTEIIEEEASITLDLTELDAADFASMDEPLEVLIDLDFGEVEVLVPEGVTVDVDASSGVGDVDVFGVSDDGILPERLFSVDDPDIELTIKVKAGAVDVRRS